MKRAFLLAIMILASSHFLMHASAVSAEAPPVEQAKDKARDYGGRLLKPGELQD